MTLDDTIPWGSSSNPSAWNKRIPLLILVGKGHFHLQPSHRTVLESLYQGTK
jgi:hypothetical protein